MSEQKAKCEKCGEEVSEKVEAYSRDHFDNHVYCYKCQKNVRGDEDTGAWTFEKPKENEEKTATSEDASAIDVKSTEDNELEEYDSEVTTELKAKSKELSKKIISLVTAMSRSDTEGFYAWLKTVYGVDDLETLNIEQKEAVLNETEKMVKGKKSEKVVDVPENGSKTVEIDEGTFSFQEEGGTLLCKNGANDNEYELDISKPECTCNDFEINKQKQEWCKHLKAASIGGYNVSKLPEIPEEVSSALVKPEKSRRTKAKKEEMMALVIMDTEIQMAVQTPGEVIQNEESATKMITDIIGANPQFSDVIEKFGSIEEVSSDVIISLAQHAGIRFQILNKEIETVRMNLGKVYMAVELDPMKRKNYSALTELMPDTDVVIRCKITAVAAWKDKSGNLRVGMGTKEEHLTPYELKDLARRGANFIETKCESKAFKKSILNALPMTHDGIRRKIKHVYGWE